MTVNQFHLLLLQMKTDNSWKRQAVSKTASIKEWFYWWWPPTVPLSCSCWEEKPWDGPGHGVVEGATGGPAALQDSHKMTFSRSLLRNGKNGTCCSSPCCLIGHWHFIYPPEHHHITYVHIISHTYVHRQQRGTYWTRLWSKSDQPVISFNLVWLKFRIWNPVD